MYEWSNTSVAPPPAGVCVCLRGVGMETLNSYSSHVSHLGGKVFSIRFFKICFVSYHHTYFIGDCI